jgi:hypothetical protein
MSPMRRVLHALAVLAALTAAACGNPPDKELQQAERAIAAARDAGAERLSPTEYAAAQEALTRARDAVVQRDYRLALNHALDARERAQAAAKDATARKAAARRDAESALAGLPNALAEARARLKAAEAAHAPTTDLMSARDAIADAQAAVQKARTVFDSGDYQGAIDAAARISASLRQISRDLDAAASAAAHRRRGGQRKN